jgi:N-acetylglucosaminyldiphosphoundecaprenol N-acetyl-beta-D-mannosaminyltransferase
MGKALTQVVEFIEKGDSVKTIFAANPEKNYSVPKDPFLYKMFKEADLLIPDGIGMVLAANWLHKTSVKRVPGCELMQNICSLAEKKGYRIFVYGAKEAVNQAAVKELEKRHPNLNIVGRQNGYLQADQTSDLVTRINDSKAQILFLALGSPKQETWIAQNRDHLKHVRVCQGIGGTLDVLAGTVKRAPAFYCKTGLEWFYRLVAEPSRIKRQAILPLFAAQVLVRKLR